jgi:hypothetical protein
MTTKLIKLFVIFETLCILILIGLLIIPKEIIEDFANVKISVERVK